MAKYKVRIYIDQTYEVESDCEHGAIGDAIMEMQKDGDMYYDIELLEGAEVVCPLCGKKNDRWYATFEIEMKRRGG